MKGAFNKNFIILGFLLIISFMTRVSFIFPWTILLPLKLLVTRNFKNFIKVFSFIVIPTILLCVLIDSLYYGDLTFVIANFYKWNIKEKVASKIFGESPIDFYLKETCYEFFNFFTYLMFQSSFVYLDHCYISK